jgi:hypothetical protein
VFDRIDFFFILQIISFRSMARSTFQFASTKAYIIDGFNVAILRTDSHDDRLVIRSTLTT